MPVLSHAIVLVPRAVLRRATLFALLLPLTLLPAALAAQLPEVPRSLVAIDSSEFNQETTLPMPPSTPAIGFPTATLMRDQPWVRLRLVHGTLFTGRVARVLLMHPEALAAGRATDSIWISVPPRRGVRGYPAQPTWRTFGIAVNDAARLERASDRGRRWLLAGTVLGAAGGFLIGRTGQRYADSYDAYEAGTVVATGIGTLSGYAIARATRRPFRTVWAR